MNKLQERFFTLIGIPAIEIQEMEGWQELELKLNEEEENFHTEGEF